MRKLLDRLTQIDKHGDSPIGLIVAIAIFLICMYAIACMPCH